MVLYNPQAAKATLPQNCGTVQDSTDLCSYSNTKTKSSSAMNTIAFTGERQTSLAHESTSSLQSGVICKAVQKGALSVP